MDTNIILTIAQAILANTRVLQSLIDHLPKEAQAEVAKTVAVKAAPVAAPIPNVQPAPTPVATVMVTPVVTQVAAPVFAVPATASPSSAVFATQAELTAFVMDSYKALGPIKGAKIQEVLNGVGVKNINEVKPEMYAAVKAGIEALKV